jgi:N-acetylglutamate synthase-like GNAT family acetyltransferase
MDITYKTDSIPSMEAIIALYNAAGLPRPTHDADRIRKMYEHATLVVTAWDGEKLVGVSRAITDWVWCCYLADLAVSPDYKQSGIGKKLLQLTKEKVGEQSMVLLLSVPTAMEYYPKVGMQTVENGFILHRSE